MTPTPTGRVETTEAGRDLILERVLPGSLDDAWASLTESDRLARWLATWTGDALAGEAMPDWDDYWPGLAAAYA